MTDWNKLFSEEMKRAAEHTVEADTSAIQLIGLLQHLRDLVGGEGIPDCVVCRDLETVALAPGAYGRCPACRGKRAEAEEEDEAP